MGSVAATAATAATVIVTAVLIIDQQENDDDEQDPSTVVAAEQVTQTHSIHPLTTPYYDGSGRVVQKNCGCKNPKATTEQAVNFLTKHELTHSVEGTQQWDQLADIVQAQLGDDKWSDAIAEVMERYAVNGKELDLPGAEYEVVADWVGKNLYKSGFAQAIVNGDATVGNAFVQAIDKLRLALGNKKAAPTPILRWWSDCLCARWRMRRRRERASGSIVFSTLSTIGQWLLSRTTSLKENSINFLRVNE